MVNDTENKKSIWKIVTGGILLLTIIIATSMTVGVNDAGYRTVVQFPNGHLWVKFEPGWYLSLFGSTEEYSDFITFDYDKNDDQESTVNQLGIPVRYQDGGLGTIFGKDRFALPNDEPTMLALHKAFRSNKGLAFKLIKPVTEEATNLTAGLMSSEAAYAEQRGTFIQWSQQQIARGKLKTMLESKQMEDEQGKKVWKKVPVPVLNPETGEMVHIPSDLEKYGITLAGHQITDWDFEGKTLDQISAKREATMGIITAKANAERAVQDEKTAEATGRAKVMIARYEKEVEKTKAIVVAEQHKAVALVSAQQKVAVAEQEKLEAEQKKLAAAEYKQEQILRGEGDGEYKRLVMEADGALQQKLAAYVDVNTKYAQAIQTQKWVPEIQFGTNTDTNSNAAQNLIDMFATKTARDLQLDMSFKSK